MQHYLKKITDQIHTKTFLYLRVSIFKFVTIN